MQILAIDPGPEVSSYVMWNGTEIEGSGTVPNAQLLLACKERHSRCLCVIEMISSYGMAVGKEIFETVVWIGRFVEAADAERIYRRDVKLHVCHDARAKDGNVRQAVIDRLGPPGRKKEPGVTYGLKGGEWQALALALTWWDQNWDKTT